VRFGFFLREAFRALRRNAVPSFAAMATVLVTVLVLGVFIPVVQATTAGANEIRAKVIADVYLKTDATNEDIARVNSEDASSSKGGDLGWLSPGDTVPDFEKAMDKLALNEVSAPVRTPFGWHLIEVVERRKQDITQDRRRDQARTALRQRKSDEQFQEFVRQQRDRAYVEYRVDDR